MGKVISDMSMSLDGFIAGPNDSVELGLGEGGERLHQRLYDLSTWRERHGVTGGETGTDAQVLEESFKNTGARPSGIRSGSRMSRRAWPSITRRGTRWWS